MNKTTECYYNSANKLFLRIQLHSYLSFSVFLAKNEYLFNGSRHPLNSDLANSIADDKYLMKQQLLEANLPIPRGISLSKKEFAAGKLKSKIKNLHYPLVAKPRIGMQGTDVLCNIKTIEVLQTYLEEKFTTYEFILIEEFHANLQSYRVLILHNKVIGTVLRIPASVIGDGLHSISELIDQTNLERQKNDTLAPILLDEELYCRLAELGIDLAHVPKKEERIILAYTSNASRGGTYKSLGKEICPKNAKLLIKAAKKLNLNLVGIDVQCEDLTIPIEESRGVIIETNTNVSVRIHEQPLEGDNNMVTMQIMQSLIWRHPIAYLNTLYNNPRTAFYLRGGLFLLFSLGLYHFL